MLTALRIAVVGAGPVGLATALLAARRLPQAELTLFDARPLDRDLATDARVLALSLGSVQVLDRLGAFDAEAAAPIREVDVSQAPPGWSDAAVRISAADQGVPMLGAVLRYGHVVAPLQTAWLAAAQAEPRRLRTRFGTAVAGLKPLADGMEIDAGFVDSFDLVVVAEGGVFAEQARRAIARDYGQTAWVGTVTLEGGLPETAWERFTADGPLALLPLKAAGGDGRPSAALVWCVPSDDDPVSALDEAQRLAVLAARLPAGAGRPVALSPLKAFALGLNAERTLVEGRVVRIGNAAQTLHPVAGQGLNLGLRDAVVLVDALRGAADLDRALRRVEWARAPDRWGLIAATDLLARGFRWRLPGLSLARGAALAAVQGLPPLRRLVARSMMFGWR